MNLSKKDKLEIAKTIIKMVTSGCVELFTGALVADVMNNVTGNRVSKVGARIGGALLGVYLGDKVGNQLCDDIDEMMDELDALKASIDEL